MNDLIYKSAVIDILNESAELLKHILEDVDIIGAERVKYEWGLGLIETCIADVKELLPTQSELDSKNIVYMIEKGINATNSIDIYSLGMRNGMRWCKSLIDGVEPKYEGDVISVDGGRNLLDDYDYYI